MLATMLANGWGGPVDDAQAFALFSRACTTDGEVTGCVGLAELRAAGRGTGKDPAAARAAVELACQRDDPRACTHLGVFVLNGVGGPADPARAAALYQRGCDAGLAVACANLGALTTTGREPLPQKPVEGRALLVRACALGDTASCEWVAAREREEG